MRCRFCHQEVEFIGSTPVLKGTRLPHDPDACKRVSQTDLWMLEGRYRRQSTELLIWKLIAMLLFIICANVIAFFFFSR